MAVSVQNRGNGWQLRVTHKLLPTPFFHTFLESEGGEAGARQYGAKLRELLDAGVVPSELLARPAKSADDQVFTAVVRAYLNQAGSLTDSDDLLLTSIVNQREIEGLRVSGITARWCEGYVSRLKAKHLAPGTIRKRIGGLGRALEWHLRRDHQAGEGVAVLNPFRAMQEGYSVYTDADRRAAGLDLDKVPTDKHRDLRLEPAVEAAVRAALRGEKRADRERAWVQEPDAEFELLLDIIVNTGMRLSEVYRLRVDQVDVERRVIRVEGSKGARAVVKPRVVPITTVMAARLKDWNTGRIGRMFSYWDGTKEDRRTCSARLSRRFATLFDYAGAPAFTEHDLRHEATCRWFTLRAPGGGWVFSDIEVCRIMGWTNTDLALRYASLRGEDLSARLA